MRFDCSPPTGRETGRPQRLPGAWKAEAGPLDEDAVAAMAKRYGL